MTVPFTCSVFQSTHLLRGATLPSRPYSACSRKFQSTHLLRGATHFDVRRFAQAAISIHAPLARCDPAGRSPCRARWHFNPRTSCEVRRGIVFLSLAVCMISIHAPLARCDVHHRRFTLGAPDFNPRTSCEVRRRTLSRARSPLLFQSTHLLRGATNMRPLICPCIHISIHAPLARCDHWQWYTRTHRLYFNPRTSCEVRQLAIYAAYLLASLIHFREPHFFGWRATMFRFFLPCSLALRTHISFSP